MGWALCPIQNKMTNAPKPARKAVPKKTAPKAVKFRSRGAHKCVTIHNKSCAGVHPALKRALFPWYVYNKDHDMPAATAQLFAKSLTPKNTRRLPYSQKQGTLFDSQVKFKGSFHICEAALEEGTSVPVC